MTHALTTQITAAQAADAPPADDHLPPGDAAPERADRPDPPQVVAEVIAGRLSGLHTLRGDLVQIATTVTDPATVVVDLTRLSVTESEATVRVVLTLSLPSRPAEPVLEDGDPR